MGTKITATQMFWLCSRSEDDTIFLRNQVSLRRSTTVPVLAYWGGFYLLHLKKIFKNQNHYLTDLEIQVWH